jgi:AcrR family transcriptional regulator
VVAAALHLADTEGLEALSMRRLGRAVGIEAMSLYAHVSSKGEILDAITEAVYADVELPPVDPELPWTDEVAALTRALRDALVRHPGTLPAVATRFATGPAATRLSDRMLAALRRAGFGAREAIYVSNGLGVFTIGVALAAVGRTPTSPQEFSEEEFRATVAAIPSAEYPTLMAAYAEAPFETYSWDDMFETMLAAMISGLATRLNAR